MVVLCVPPATSTNFPSFWPEGRHSKKYGPVFTIDHISHNHYTNIKTWVSFAGLKFSFAPIDNLPPNFKHNRRGCRNVSHWNLDVVTGIQDKQEDSVAHGTDGGS